MNSKKPNIIILNPDQMRLDTLHHMGNEAAVTPNFDRLALEDGVSFEHAFCQNPVCVPSRCSFLTGQYPHVRGHRTMYYMLQPDEPILFEELKNNGYYVWMNNRNDFLDSNSPRLNEICDELLDTPFILGEKIKRPSEPDLFYSFYRGTVDTERCDDTDWRAVEKAIQIIHDHPKDRPFCLFLPLIFPHVPYQVEKRFYDMIDQSKLQERIPTPSDWSGKPKILKGIYDLQNLSGWSEEQFREIRTLYLAMCARVDEQMGLIIEALKEEGLYEETAVFMFSDHGDYTGDYGLMEKNQNTFEDCLTNVPFIMKPPKSYAFQPGRRSQLIELVDFYATVADLSGLPDTHTHFGKSLLPILDDPTYAFRDAVFAEGGRLKGEQHAMDTGNGTSVKVENEYYPRLYQQTLENGAHTKAAMCRTHRYKYVRRAYESDEFYDLENDSRELANEIDNPAYGEVIREMKDRMLTWYQETCDVVPYRLDSRISLESLIRSCEPPLSEDAAQELRKRYGNVGLNSNSIQEIFKWIQSNKR